MQSFDMVSIFLFLPFLDAYVLLPRRGKENREKKKTKKELPYLTVSPQQTFACKKCKKCFRKDTSEFEDRYVARKERAALLWDVRVWYQKPA